MASEKHEVDLTKVPFEEALNRTGFGLYNYVLTAFTGFSIISFACVVYGSTIIVPASACELGTSEAQRGLLVAAPVIGLITGAILWGYLADTRGRKSMLLLSFISGAVVNALASISVNWIMLMVLQFTAALLASGQYSLPMTILSESVPMGRRNLVLLLVTSIFLLAQGIMAVLAMPIIPLTFSHYVSGLDIYWNSWRTLLLFYCCLPLLSAVWLFFMHESPKYVYARGKEEEALEILRRIHGMNNRRTREELNVKGLQTEPQSQTKLSAKDQIVPLFKMPLLKYTIIMTLLSVFLQVGAFMLWLPNIANQFIETVQTGAGADLPLCGIIAAAIADGPADTACSLNVTALLLVFTVGAIQSVFNAMLMLGINKVGRRNTVIGLSAVCGLAGIAVNWVPNAIGSAVLFLVFLLGMPLIGLYTAISVALFPTHLRALAVSLTMTGGRIAIFATIQIVNVLLNNNCHLAFYIFAAIVGSSAIVASFLPDDRVIMRQLMAAAQAQTQLQPQPEPRPIQTRSARSEDGPAAIPTTDL